MMQKPIRNAQCVILVKGHLQPGTFDFFFSLFGSVAPALTTPPEWGSSGREQTLLFEAEL